MKRPEVVLVSLTDTRTGTVIYAETVHQPNWPAEPFRWPADTPVTGLGIRPAVRVIREREIPS